MATLTMPSVSTQPVQQQILAISGGLPYNPSADAVAMAFILLPQYGPPPDPQSGDWHTATWETDANPVTYWASCLVGPANGGTALSLGTYQVWLKITDSPTVPVEQPCLLTITP